MRSIKDIDAEDVIYFLSECIKRCNLRVQGLKNLSSNSELEKVNIIIKDYHIRKPSYLPPYAYELASVTATRVGEVVEQLHGIV